MRALYRVSCTACPNFELSTDSHYEARRIRQFHDNWNNSWSPSSEGRHEVRIVASRFTQPAHHVQVHIEDAAGVPA